MGSACEFDRYLKETYQAGPYLFFLGVSMAGVEPASADANAENVRLVPNYPGPYHYLGCNSSSAEARGRQYLKRYLRHSMLRERVSQPGRELLMSIRPSPAPELRTRVSFVN